MIYKTEDGRPYFLYEEPSADKEGAKRTRLGIIDVESSPHVKSKETREAKASERVAVNCSNIFDITDGSILKNHLPTCDKKHRYLKLIEKDNDFILVYSSELKQDSLTVQSSEATKEEQKNVS